MLRARLFFTLLFLLAPATSSAAVLISEIMYDVSGTDTGREWVEIANTGTSAVDVTGFKLFEANTNHGLVLHSGSGVLAAGAVAVIADDAEKFLADWPSYSGTLFESSFSLSNAGELLTLRDNALVDMDSVSYDVSAGAAGDGNTLTRSGTSFIAAAPTPGTYISSGTPTNAQTETQTSVQTTPSSQSQGSTLFVPTLTVKIEIESSVLVGAGSFFDGFAYGTKGEPLSANVRYLWNFGDGTTAEGKRVFHAYTYPGTYVVQLSAAYNYMSGSARGTIEAKTGAVSLEAQKDGSALIKNTTSQDVNIGLWSLTLGEKRFVIPEDTFVFAGEGVRFAPATIGFSADTSTVLFYPNGTPALLATPSSDSPLRGERVVLPSMRASSVTYKEPSQQEDFSEEGQGSTFSASVATSGEDFPFWSSVAGLVALLSIGAGSVWYLQGSTRPVTLRPEDEFEIE